MKIDPTPPLVTPYQDYLFVLGEKLGCYFTLEYRSTAPAGEPSKLLSEVTNDQRIATIPVLLARLKRDLVGFTITQDAKHETIIHVVETSLANDVHYPLNRRATVRYTGNLVGCIVKDREGRNLTEGEGLVVALNRSIEGIKDGSASADPRIAFNDCVTKVKVDAVNEEVRGILTDCLPLKKYNRILWRAVKAERGGQTAVFIQFYGPKN